MGSQTNTTPAPDEAENTQPNVLNPEQDMMREHVAQNTPIPQSLDDDDLVCEGLHCEDMEPESVQPEANQAWQCEIYVTESDVES